MIGKSVFGCCQLHGLIPLPTLSHHQVDWEVWTAETGSRKISGRKLPFLSFYLSISLSSSQSVSESHFLPFPFLSFVTFVTLPHSSPFSLLPYPWFLPLSNSLSPFRVWSLPVTLLFLSSFSLSLSFNVNCHRLSPCSLFAILPLFEPLCRNLHRSSIRYSIRSRAHALSLSKRAWVGVVSISALKFINALEQCLTRIGEKKDWYHRSQREKFFQVKLATKKAWFESGPLMTTVEEDCARRILKVSCSAAPILAMEGSWREVFSWTL